MSITVDEDVLIINNNIQTDVINERTLNNGVSIDNVLLKDGGLTLNSTIQSTTTDSGALIVGGGIGVAKDVFMGNDLTVKNNTTIENILTLGAISPFSFPSSAGSLGQVLTMSTNGSLVFETPSGGGDPNAVLAPSVFGSDNRLVRTLGTIRNVEATAIEVSDDNDIFGVNSLTITGTGISTNGTSGALIVAGGVGISGNLNVVGDLTFDGALVGEVSTGSPETPSTSYLGEGESYTDTMVVLSNSNLEVGTWVDNTVTAVSDTGSTFNAFQGTGVNNAWYVGSDYRFTGLFLVVTTALASGQAPNLNYQYWNGTTWATHTFMSTQTAAPYDSFAKRGLEQAITQEFRIGIKGSELALKTLNGNNKYWVRFVINSTITTIPVLEQIKVHTNRLQVNTTGFVEYFGLSRPVLALPWGINLVRPLGGNSPNNSDLYVSDNLGVGAVENRFGNSVLDRVGFHSVLPGNMDTSFPLKFDIKFMVFDTDNGDIQFTVRWGYTGNGDNIYVSTGSAPTTGPNELSQTKLISMAGRSANTQYDETFILDISDLNTRKIGNDKDILWVIMERNGNAGADDFTEEMVIVQISAQYVKWCEGGYLSDYVIN